MTVTPISSPTPSISGTKRTMAAAGDRKTVGTLAVFAVVAANYQRTNARYPRKSWVADVLPNRITAKRSLLFRCFLLFFDECINCF
jgi:hypothetical protein